MKSNSRDYRYYLEQLRLRKRKQETNPPHEEEKAVIGTDFLQTDDAITIVDDTGDALVGR